jgi:hypothetical protein
MRLGLFVDEQFCVETLKRLEAALRSAFAP